jgi:hypothetical protein
MAADYDAARLKLYFRFSTELRTAIRARDRGAVAYCIDELEVLQMYTDNQRLKRACEQQIASARVEKVA